MSWTTITSTRFALKTATFNHGEVVYDEAGRLTIRSSFGDWQNTWNPQHIGQKTFAHFLAQLDRSYLADKLRVERETDKVLSIKHVRQTILELRRHEDVTELWARTEWDLADEIAHSEDIWMQTTGLDEPWDYLSAREVPGFDRFYTEIWCAFRAELKARLLEAA